MNKIAKTALASLFLLVTGGAQAAAIDTVDWAADGSLDGTGTGTLQSGAITVIYTTVVGVGNAGASLVVNWNTSLATDSVGSVNHFTGGIFGTTAGLSPAVQTISFSAAVIDPILFINFVDQATQMDFGGLNLTFLDSNNAQLVGSVVSFPGSVNNADAGFAARITGTFGPGTPISFAYNTSTPFDSVGFTVGLPVPEPSSLFLLAAGSLPLLTRRLRRS